ncbi:MAG: hypothetical protein U5J62_03445 [Desulfurivibrio sp.]|nr:hypothetical protein [Desulfurivibrio sp.]
MKMKTRRHPGGHRRPPESQQDVRGLVFAFKKVMPFIRDEGEAKVCQIQF